MNGVRYSAATHVGRVRQVNEDSLLSLPDHGIWVVSDGMGGHEAGDFASQTITDMIAALEPDYGPGEMIRALRHAIQRAHEVILAEAAARGAGTIGATIVTLSLTDGHFAALWAGDSRLYRLRGDEIEMLTTDHSLVAALVESGQIGWDEVEQHPQANVITRAVGIGDTLELEKIRGAVQRGDRFLLCSDGLTKYAPQAVLKAHLRNTGIETVADQLLNVALEGGGADNISLIVVDVR